MKNETETAVRSILSMDAEVTKECLERAIDVLRGKAESDEDMVHTIKFCDALDLLKVCRRTLTYYLDHGYLERVYGCGHRALGVSRESLLRFMNRRVVRTRDPQTNNLRRGRPPKKSLAAESGTKERKHK